MINIDYYIGDSYVNARNHCLRGYQDKNKLLILLPIHANGKRVPPINIPHSHNVLILEPKEFAEFLGYKDKIKSDFLKVVKLTKNSVWKEDGSRETLNQVYIESKNKLYEKYNFSQKELEEYLRDPSSKITLDILKYKPDKTSLDYFIVPSND